MSATPPLARVALLALVGLGYATVVYSLLGGRPPVWTIAALLVTLLVFLNVCICFLNLAAFVDVVSRGPTSRAAVALTFDDGPHPVHTRAILDHLDAAGAKATFFVIGAKAEAHPDVVAEIARRGHEVGLHSWSHDHILFMRSEAAQRLDTERTQDVVERATGTRPRLFRPPVGFSSPRTRTIVRELGLTVVGWSARAFDGAGRPSTEQIMARLEPSLTAGAVVLLHDAAEQTDEAPTSIVALPALLAKLRERGLSSVTISTLVSGGGAKEHAVVPQTAP